MLRLRRHLLRQVAGDLNAVVGEKAEAIERSGAQLLLGGDLGCLMNMAGKLKRKGSNVRAFHAAEVLAGMGGGPAIGEER